MAARKTKKTQDVVEYITVDLTPLNDFQYCQISNHKFEYMLLDEQNRVLHSAFECKDYIQDIFYAEITKKPSAIFGIHWKPGMMNLDREFFRVLLSGGSVELHSKAKPIVSALNVFEDALGIPHSTYKMVQDNPKMITIDFSKEWTVNGPLLSALTTLMRVMGSYDGSNMVEFIKKLHANHSSLPAYMQKDARNLPHYMKRLFALLQGKRPEHSWKDFQGISSVHNTGIIGFKGFPEVEA